MNITDVRIRKVEREGKLKAVASITIDDVFVVHDIKIIDGAKGMFIAMPSKQSSDGTYRDVAHPISTEMREELRTLLVKKYEEYMATTEA